MRLDAARSRLVLVDYQARLMPAIAGGEAVLQRALTLARAARLLDVPVLGTEQNPDRLGPNDPALRALCAQTLPKMHFGACADGLLEALPPPAATARAGVQVVLGGCEAHVCLLQTALGLHEAGHEVWVARDACGSRRDAERDAAFERLARQGIGLATTEMVVFEWLGSATHPRFREVLALVK